MKRYLRPQKEDENIEAIVFCSKDVRFSIVSSVLSGKLPILAGISARDMTKSMVRVRSSNIWSYCINIRNRNDRFGDIYVQFKKETGGPGDIYVLYDVPVGVYKKWITAPSKGHYYWQYLRNNYRYSKLTGDKRGKLKNAINH